MSSPPVILAGPFTPSDAAILAPKDLLPRGSACITTSGDLASRGMPAIVQAATGSMNLRGGIFEPTLQSIKDSIENGFKLLIAHGYSRMAVPFVGGNIFISRIGVTAPVLAHTILDACLTNYTAETVIVSNDPGDVKTFRDVVTQSFPHLDPNQVVLDCGILSFHQHKAPVIMNAANMEVHFGGGLSSIIGNATGQMTQIDNEALSAIQAFWKTQAETTS